ncbi:MAG: hypothetical protein IRZ23_08525 [Acetobacteraceae bacterium]|nr:hypothetical protein [Acetobacteraceae bacterium]
MRIPPSILAGAVAATLALGTAWAGEKPEPINSGQTTGTPTSTPTWTVPGAQPSNITIKQKSSNIRGATDPAARENGACDPPYEWSTLLKKCVIPLNSPMSPNNPAAIQGKSVSNNAGSTTGTPMSPPGSSGERIVIKTKSSPPVAPQNPQHEERGAGSTNPTGKPSAASLGAVPQCGPGTVWVQEGPHHGQGHCVVKPIPKD